MIRVMIANRKSNSALLPAKFLDEISKGKAPVLITENGQPKAYVLNVPTFEKLQARLRIMEGIARGEKAIQQGKTLSHQKAKQRLKKWLG
jgi:prevent-host-death family protein